MRYDGHPDQYYGPTTYSQHGEDFLIIDLFRQLGKDKFSYLDLGAHHPINISNTALMYERGCRGVNVEANPNLIAEFNRLRPEDINVNFGVHTENGEADFHMYDPTSGRNTFSFQETSTVDMKVKSTMKVATLTLTAILNRYCNGKFPSFLNIDIEGLDFEILDNFDFLRNYPTIICVETRLKKSREMTQLMARKGFNPFARLGENIIYVENAEFMKLNMNMGL